MPNDITYRIKGNSDWFIKDGEPGSYTVYSDRVQEIAKLIPRLAEVLSLSTPLNVAQNIIEKVGLQKGVELTMLVTGIGGTPLQLLNEYFKHLGSHPVRLDANITWNSQSYQISRELQRFGAPRFPKITHENFLNLSDDILEDLLFILCFGFATTLLGKFHTWRKCDLAALCGKDMSEVSSRLLMGILNGHQQIQGVENVSTGGIAEQKVRDIVNEIVLSSGSWVTITPKIPWINKHGESVQKKFDLSLRIESPFSSLSNLPPKYIGIEIAWQETGNSVIHRKDSEYQDVLSTANQLGHRYCIVVDGVGYFSRAKAMDSIVMSAHCSVGLADPELQILRAFILNEVEVYKAQCLPN